jgi:hypothetical protein
MNQTTILGRSGVVMGLNKSIVHKHKMHKLVPTISHRSKVINKGTSYDEKILRRKHAMVKTGKTQGSNNLSAKKVNEKKWLSKVEGMALTQAQKKKLAKKAKRAEAKEESEEDVSDDDSME